MRIVLAFLIAASLWPGAASAAGISPVNPFWGIIFPAEQAPALARQCSREAPSAQGAWLPSAADIVKLEAGLNRVLSDAKVQPGAYYRQYGGLIVGGRRIIYVNGARNAVVPPNWRMGAISICDGGALAFGVEYDPASGAFTHFAFNGHL